MKRLIYIFLSLLIVFTSSIAAQRRSTRRTPSTPVPSPSPVQAAVNTSVESQASLTQQIEDLSIQIERGMTNNQKRTIAVVEFVDLNSRITNFGRFLAEELITRLHQKKFRVIERQLLNRVVAEQKLSLTGAIDQASAQKLGKILGVDAIVSGTITDLGKKLRVNARLISTETGEVFAVASTTVAKDDEVVELMSSGGGTAVTSDNRTTTPQSILPTAPAQPRKPVSRSVQAKFFTFELQQCRKSGTSVICDFVITNNDKDRELQTNSYNANMYDEYGNQSHLDAVEIANKRWTAFLVSGVPTKARFYFEKVSPDAKKISVVYLHFYSGERFTIEFRDIPLLGAVGAELMESPLNIETAISSSTPVNSNTGGSAIPKSGERSVTVYPNGQWVDSGIDVEPGMRFNVTASGTISTNGASPGATVVGSILGSVLGGNASGRSQPMRRSSGPNALIAKIRYTNGRDSNTVAVGAKNTFTIEPNEYGRLLFGIDRRYSSYTNGYFNVKVQW